MRLWVKDLWVGNFGARRDWALPSLRPGLNLLFGPNESGKTTLLQFLRGMLFGFDRSPLMPLDGEPGGGLTLADEQGREWLLERWGRGKKARVNLSGAAATLGEAGLRALLQHVSRPVYENVFAFGLSELANLKSLDQQGVRELLYSASLGLGRVSLAKVEADLQKQADTLFNPDPRAKKPEINQLLVELAGVRQTLTELARQPEEYQALLTDLARLEADIVELTQKRQDAEGKRHHLQKLAQAWAVWEDWQEVEADLKALPRVDTFPENGLDRLARLADEHQRVEGELGEHRRALTESRDDFQALFPDLSLLEQAPDLEALWDERLLFETRREELARQDQELAAAQARLAGSFGHLGPGWDENRLENFPLSLAWRHGIQERQKHLEEAQQNLRQVQAQCQLYEEALREREAAWEQARDAGLAGTAGWVVRWGFVLAGGLLAGAAGALALWQFWKLAVWTGAGAGAALLLALVLWLHLRSVHHRHLASLDGDRGRAQETLSRAQADLESAQGEVERLQDDWHQRLAADSFPPDLSPAVALELAQELERAQGHLQTLRGVIKERDVLGRFLEEYTARLAEVSRRLGLPEASVTEVNPTLVRFKKELTQHQKILEKKTLLETDISSLQGKVIRGEESVQRLEVDIQDLFKAAGVQDQEEFRQRAELYERRQQLLNKSRRLEVELRLLAGGEEALEDFTRELEHTTQADLGAGLDRAAQELGDLDTRLAQAREDKGRLAHRRDNLERTEELGQALLAEQTLAARLTELARHWTVLVLSRSFLEQGRRRFEADSQPQVLKEASRFVAELTEGRYIQIIAPLEDEKILVVSQKGQHVPVERLSRGTVEQLYLALRFSLIQSYHQAGVNLPLVLDDTLVNFDHRRARRAVRLLEEMSATHQLLLFTCHPHIVTLMAEVLGPAAPPPIVLEETP